MRYQSQFNSGNGAHGLTDLSLYYNSDLMRNKEVGSSPKMRQQKQNTFLGVYDHSLV